MDESLRLLLIEADMYKEEMEKTWFKLVQFSQRLQLTENETLNALGSELLVKTAEFNEIAALLEQSASAVSLALTQTGESEENFAEPFAPENKEEEEAIAPAESAFAPAEEGVFAPAEESVFAPAEESVFAPAEEGVFAPAEEGVFAPAEESVFAPAEESVFAPAEEGVFAPAEESVFAPVDESVFAPAEESVFTPDDKIGSAPPFDVVEISGGIGQPELPHDDVVFPEVAASDEAVVIPSEFSYIDEDGTIHCGKCGHKLRKVSKFCSACGNAVKFREDEVPAKEEPARPEIINKPAPSGVHVDFTGIEEAEPEEGIFESPEDTSEKAPLGGFVSKPRPAATLLRHKNNSLILIDKDEFLIGREAAKTNYSIPDNNAISRVHMKIFFENERYYIIDCDSVNGTYLNEKSVSSHTPEMLFDGSEIRINTETFTFQVSY